MRYPRPQAAISEYSSTNPISNGQIDLIAWPTGAAHVRGYVGLVTMEWPSDVDVPLGAKRKLGGLGEASDEIVMETGVKSRKKGSKVSDNTVSAEDAAAVLLLRALRMRERKQPPLEILKISGVRRVGVGGLLATDEQALHQDGTKVDFSFRLEVMAEDEAAEGGVGASQGEVLEEGREEAVLLGAAVLHPLVEDLLVETSVGSTTCAQVTTSYLGIHCQCRLTLTLHSATPPSEEKYEACLGGGGKEQVGIGPYTSSANTSTAGPTP